MKLKHLTLILGIMVGSVSFSQTENQVVGNQQLIEKNATLATLAEQVNTTYEVFKSANSSTRTESANKKAAYSSALENYISELENLIATADDKSKEVYSEELSIAQGLQNSNSKQSR